MIIRQAVRPLPPKGGDAYADYFDVACLRTYRDDQNKKSKTATRPSDGFVDISDMSNNTISG